MTSAALSLEGSHFFAGKKVLITGGVGFLGSNLAIRLLELGSDVTLIDTLSSGSGANLFNIGSLGKDVRVVVGGMGDQKLIAPLISRVDVVFNLAGKTSHLDSMEDPFQDLDSNVVEQLRFLELCRKLNPGLRIIFASTRQVYGKPEYLPVDEKHAVNVVDVNGVNKVAAENYHHVFQAVYGLRPSILRLTNSYGPRMRVKDARQNFLGIWVKKAIAGEAIEIFGDGTQLRDFNHVADVVDAFLRVAARDECIGKTYNLGSEEPLSLRAIADIFISLESSTSVKIVPFPEKLKGIDIGNFYGDFRLLEQETGWRPRHSMESGLSETLDFYRENRAQYGI